MNLTRFAIKRPVGITMIVMLFVVLGLYSFSHLGVELLPAMNTPFVTVSVSYPGAGPEEIEQQVIKPLEESLSSVSNLKHMTSMVSQERALIILEFSFGANSDIASIDVSKKVSAVRSKLPDSVNEPVVVKRDINAEPIMEIAVTSQYPLSDMYTKANGVFKEHLERANGVSEVELNGGRDKEVAVEIDKDKLSFYHVSLNQVVNLIRGENILLPAGSVYSDKNQADVRLIAQYKTPEDINHLQVSNFAGINIPLTEIATIKEQDSRVNRYSRVNGQEAVSLAIYKNSDANLVDTVNEVQAELEKLKHDYPNYQFTEITNSADFVKKSLKGTLIALMEGIFTTALVLYLFLRGWRSTAAVIIAIPTSLIACFFAMYIAGFSFNMMSLMGMTFCVGILVDDSIVVLENIHRHLKLGKNAEQAAEDGRMEIGMAAIAITLCDVVVFMPIAFMTGMIGQSFRQFGLTIVFATLFSLFVSFTLTPMIAAKLYRKGLEEPQGKLWSFMNGLEKRVIAKYEQILKWSLGNSKKVLVTVLFLFILSFALIPAGIIGSEYMPQTDESSFRVSVELPVGDSLEQTDKVVSKLEEYINTIPEVRNCLSAVGIPSSNNAFLTVQLVDQKKRERSVWEIADLVRGFAGSKLGLAKVRVSETQSSIVGVSGGAGSGHGFANAPIQIELRGNNIEDLIRSSKNLQTLLAQISGVKDIRSSYTEGIPELQLSIDREKMKFYGTSVSEVSNTFSAAIAGQKAGVLTNDPQNDGQDTDIVVRLKNSEGFKETDLRSIPIRAGAQTINLGEVANISQGTGPVMIRRVDKERSINVQANLTDRPLKEVLQEIQQRLKTEKLSSGITYRFAGQVSSMGDTFAQMFLALGLSLILVYMLLAILYESFSTPMIRMLSLPLGLIGAFLFLALTKNTINLYSLIGILVMDGLVAKNGTLLLDYTLTLMDKGMNAYDAIIEAGKTRLRPIFMTTLTMVVGMLPTALSMTEGAETRSSMAWVIIGGLLSSTIFTLIIIPIIFLFFNRLQGKRKVVNN